MERRAMTEEEMRMYILKYLAELYEAGISRTQWKRFSFEHPEDRRLAARLLKRMVADLILDQKEPGVVRLNALGYKVIQRDLSRLRLKEAHVPVPEDVSGLPPTAEEIREISGDLGQVADYLTSSRIKNGQSEIIWATEGFEKVTGYTVAEINESGGTAMLAGKDDIESLKRIAEQLLNGEKLSGEIQLKHKTGEIFLVRFVAWPRFDEEGRVMGTLTAARRKPAILGSSPPRTVPPSVTRR